MLKRIVAPFELKLADDAAPPTVEQHQDALIELLQDEPMTAVQDALSSLNHRLTKLWGERRKQQIPTRDSGQSKVDAINQDIAASLGGTINRLASGKTRKRRK